MLRVNLEVISKKFQVHVVVSPTTCVTHSFNINVSLRYYRGVACCKYSLGFLWVNNYTKLTLHVISNRTATAGLYVTAWQTQTASLDRGVQGIATAARWPLNFDTAELACVCMHACVHACMHVYRREKEWACVFEVWLKAGPHLAFVCLSDTYCITPVAGWNRLNLSACVNQWWGWATSDSTQHFFCQGTRSICIQSMKVIPCLF